MKALIPKVINGRIIITNKNDYDEVHITVDEMEDILNNAYQQGAREFLAWYSGGETMPSFGRYAKCNIDDVIAEWQKGEEK